MPVFCENSLRSHKIVTSRGRSRLSQKSVRIRTLSISAAAAMFLAGCGSSSSPNGGATANTTGLAAATESAASTASSSGSTPTALTTLTVQQFPGAWEDALLWVANDKGMFANHGLKVNLTTISTSPAGIAALQGGSIQLGFGAMDTVVEASAKGIHVKVVTGNAGNVYTLVGKNGLAPEGVKYPNVMQYLKGVKIGVPAAASSPERFAQLSFTEAGMPADSATFVAVGGPGRVTGLQHGTIDAAVTTQPQEATIEALGVGHTLVAYQSGEGPQEVRDLNACFQGFFALDGWVDQHADEVKAFNAALRDAEQWVYNPANLEAFVAVLHKNGPIAVPNQDQVELKETKGMLADHVLKTSFDPSCLDNWNSLLLKAGFIKKAVPVSDMVWSGLDPS